MRKAAGAACTICPAPGRARRRAVASGGDISCEEDGVDAPRAGLPGRGGWGKKAGMGKPGSSFSCTACGAVHRKWIGRCDACGGWDTVVEEAPLAAGAGARTGGRRGRAVALSTLDSAEPAPARSLSGLAEFDRVLGGGLVPASAILVGGDPGIGKSTLLLQAAARFALAGLPCLYVSGEEASAQVRMRAERLGLAAAPVLLAAETNLRDILATLEAERPGLVVIDSIQTMWLDTVESAPGSVAQVRAAAHELVNFAKRRGSAVVLVGHVTKEGQIAGPRVVEHMVDTVLYFEGERGHPFRILRSVKNRFGPADEIGVFEMTGAGLAEVANPSALFLAERDRPAPGSVVFAGIEGSRPMLTEIQALVAPSPLGTPRRTAVGLDGARLSTILAVLEARCGIPFSGLDVFLNVAGGLRVSEPAADLAVAVALLSAREDIAVPTEMVIFGEISLSGALRPVGQTENRLKEARKLGFTQAIAPTRSKVGSDDGMRVRQIPDLATLVGEMFGAG
jgi:DNA repair protein RadA/Sms